MEYVKKFSNLNIFLSHFFHKIAGNCWDEALAEDPRWATQQRFESSLEIKLLFPPLSLLADRVDGVGVGLFIYACMGEF